MLFKKFGPQLLRDAIEEELKKTNDVKIASMMAIKNLKENPEHYVQFGILSKAKKSAKEKKIEKVMREFEAGKLKSSSGKIVTNRDQALAIAYSEAENMSKAKYVRRTGSPGNYKYEYADEKEPKKTGVLSNIMSFFGFKDEKQAKEKITEVYNKNKKELPNVNESTFTDYMNEYLSNKEMWDKKLAKKEIVGKDKKTGKIERKKATDKKTAVVKKEKSWNLSLMRKVAGIVSETRKEKVILPSDIPKKESYRIKNKDESITSIDVNINKQKNEFTVSTSKRGKTKEDKSYTLSETKKKTFPLSFYNSFMDDLKKRGGKTLKEFVEQQIKKDIKESKKITERKIAEKKNKEFKGKINKNHSMFIRGNQYSAATDYIPDFKNDEEKKHWEAGLKEQNQQKPLIEKIPLPKDKKAKSKFEIKEGDKSFSILNSDVKKIFKYKDKEYFIAKPMTSYGEFMNNRGYRLYDSQGKEFPVPWNENDTIKSIENWVENNTTDMDRKIQEQKEKAEKETKRKAEKEAKEKKEQEAKEKAEREEKEKERKRKKGSPQEQYDQYKQDIAVFEEDFARKDFETEEEWKDEIQSFEDEGKENIRTATESYKDDLEELKEDHEDELKTLKENHEDDLEEIKENYKKKIYTKEEYEERVKDQKEEYESDVKKYKEGYERDTKKSKEEYEERISESKNELKKINNYRMAQKQLPKIRDKLLGPKLFKAKLIKSNGMYYMQKAAAPLGKISIGKDGKKYKKIGQGKWVLVKEGEDQSKKKSEKQPDKGKDKEPLKGKEEQKKATTEKIKETLKKMATILADALSAKDVVQPTGEAVEQTGETAKRDKKEVKQKDKKQEKDKNKENPNKDKSKK